MIDKERNETNKLQAELEIQKLEEVKIMEKRGSIENKRKEIQKEQGAL